MAMERGSKWARYWPWPPLSRGDIIAAIVCFVFIGALLFGLAVFPNFGRNNPNAGLGPDWDCSRLPHTEPVCVKRVPDDPTSAAKPTN
jgi:hypothetical protein